MYIYPVAIELGNENTAFGVVVHDLPGCYSAGDSMDEALENTKEAIEFHLEGLAEQGELPPAPSDLKDVAAMDEYKGWVLGFVQIDVEPFLGKSSKINVTLPNLLTRKIDEFVLTHPEFKNRSNFLQLAALNTLEKV